MKRFAMHLRLLPVLCAAVKRKIFRQKFPYGEMIKVEKVRKLSGRVEKIYVNQFAYKSGRFEAVENPVDNVEK